jgi:ribose transport system ATP-binding protein
MGRVGVNAPLSTSNEVASDVRALRTDVDVPLLSVRGLTKRFPGTLALEGLDLDVRRGEIHAILGENGAGKSTFIKILAGIYPADAGVVTLEGAPVRPNRNGLPGAAFIHQDLALVDSMSVMENIGHTSGFPRRFGLIAWSAMRRRAEAILSTLQADINPMTLVSRLPQAEKAIVAIARAIATQDVRLLVLDEPTASLSEVEVARVIKTLESLKGRHVGIVFVTHRLDEVFRIADRVTVLRDGRHVLTTPVQETDRSRLVTAIVGRPPEEVFSRNYGASTGAVVAEFDGVCVGSTGPCSFTVRAGEVVALVGLQGAGQNDLGRAVIGDERISAGLIRYGGADYRRPAPTRSVEMGIGFISSKRLEESLAPALTIRENLFANPSIPNREVGHWINPRDEARDSLDLITRYGIRVREPETPVATLSGGNQQRVVLARWLSARRGLLVLEEPTMGVDVGAKAEIYRMLRDALTDGLAVLLISSDLEEVSGIATRALVLNRGLIACELRAAELTFERLVHEASGNSFGSSKVHA